MQGRRQRALPCSQEVVQRSLGHPRPLDDTVDADRLDTNLTTLIVFRMVQAVGGSMLNPVAMSIITNTFTIPRERAQAIGVWAAVVGVSMALGPVVGGLLVTSVGWRSIFWINIPIGLTRRGPRPALHPRVQGTGGEEGRRPRAGAGDRAAGLAHLRHHRSPRPGLVVDPHRRSLRGRRACRSWRS